MKRLTCLFALLTLASGHYLTKEQNSYINFTSCSPSTDDDNVYKYSVDLLNDEVLNLTSLRQTTRAILLVNVATFCRSAIEYPALNRLKEEFGNDLAVLAFPSHQFANQEPIENEEILNAIQYVRPGNGFVPLFNLTKKVDINGPKASPVFDFLKRSCPAPNFQFYSDRYYLYKPGHSRDVRWNFEKFLVDSRSGQPLYRYRTEFSSDLIAPHIRELIALRDRF